MNSQEEPEVKRDNIRANASFHWLRRHVSPPSSPPLLALLSSCRRAIPHNPSKRKGQAYPHYPQSDQLANIVQCRALTWKELTWGGK